MNYASLKANPILSDIINSHVGQININFEYTDSIPTTKAGKYKFIVNLHNKVDGLVSNGKLI